MDKEKLLFIINPISGAKNKIRIPDLIKRNLDLSIYSFEIAYTERPLHAVELVQEGLKNDVSSFIAVGGDGTINETARGLIHTEAKFGIIPSGSGNGLSRHLGIPLNPANAILTINKQKIKRIDTCAMNDVPFFCTAGVGFDAHIGSIFAKSKVRGFNTYVRTTISEFLDYKADEYKITLSGKTVSKKAFLITFANASQYGNNAFISPNALIDDGLIDVCILTPFPKYQVLSFGISLFKKSAHKSRFLEIEQAKEVLVERTCNGASHVDGEPLEMGKIIEIKIKPKSLNVLVP